MESLSTKQFITKYSVLLCMIISALLIVIATLFYPGGSLLDKNSVGFGWSRNFMSNLFEKTAINGMVNAGWIWAIVGMAFHSLGYGLFFIHISKKIPSKLWATLLKYIGITNILLIFLIATPLHDVGTLSIILTLVGLFTITMFVIKSKRHFLKFCCISCLLTFYCFFFLFGFGYMDWAIILQKVYNLSAILLVLGLEYFIESSDFHPINTVKQNA